MYYKKVPSTWKNLKFSNLLLYSKDDDFNFRFTGDEDKFSFISGIKLSYATCQKRLKICHGKKESVESCPFH